VSIWWKEFLHHNTIAWNVLATFSITRFTRRKKSSVVQYQFHTSLHYSSGKCLNTRWSSLLSGCFQDATLVSYRRTGRKRPSFLPNGDDAADSFVFQPPGATHLLISLDSMLTFVCAYSSCFTGIINHFGSVYNILDVGNKLNILCRGLPAIRQSLFYDLHKT
jgi:hypothetical protein